MAGAVHRGTRGSAQRTGATVYYLEVFPVEQGTQAAPILALMPVPGHVDVVIAGELAEAGRAMLRGLVTRERTTVIASTHRDFAIDEKSAMSDGRVDAERLRALVRAGREPIHRVRHGGGGRGDGKRHQLRACSGPLPAPGSPRSGKEACAGVIRAMGVAVDANLRAFEAGYSRSRGRARAGARDYRLGRSGASQCGIRTACRDCSRRSTRSIPSVAGDIVVAALRKLIDYQDTAFAHEYLECLAPILATDRAEENYRLTRGDRAVSCAGNDVRRRHPGGRPENPLGPGSPECAGRCGPKVGQVVAVEEFMHPRVEEICDVMPVRLGSWCLKTQPMRRFIGLLLQKGPADSDDRDCPASCCCTCLAACAGSGAVPCVSERK